MSRIPESIKSTREILNGPDDILQSLCAQSRQLLNLGHIVKQFVPEGVAVASCNQGVLTLVTPSGTVATHIRYHQRNIISSLRQADQKLAVSSLKVLVRPHYPPPKKQDKQHRVMSTSNARQMAETAGYIEDEPLRKALIKLSRRGSSAD